LLPFEHEFKGRDEGAHPGLCRVPLVRPVIRGNIAVISKGNSTLSPAAKVYFPLLMTEKGAMGPS
jgi:hypothetical protein